MQLTHLVFSILAPADRQHHAWCIIFVHFDDAATSEIIFHLKKCILNITFWQTLNPSLTLHYRFSIQIHHRHWIDKYGICNNQPFQQNQQLWELRIGLSSLLQQSDKLLADVVTLSRPLQRWSHLVVGLAVLTPSRAFTPFLCSHVLGEQQSSKKFPCLHSIIIRQVPPPAKLHGDVSLQAYDGCTPYDGSWASSWDQARAQ